MHKSQPWPSLVARSGGCWLKSELLEDPLIGLPQQQRPKPSTERHSNKVTIKNNGHNTYLYIKTNLDAAWKHLNEVQVNEKQL